MNWLKKTWSNKFVRDRIFAFAFLIVMFTGFWHAYHANSDFHKLIGLVPGVISLVAIFALVFEDFNPKDLDEDNNDNDDNNNSSRK